MTVAQRAEEATALQEAIARLLTKLNLLEGRPVCLDEGMGLGPCRWVPGEPDRWCEACTKEGRPLP